MAPCSVRAESKSTGPFHPRNARVWDAGNRRFVWRDLCGNNLPDHQLGGGFEWEGDSRNYLALGEADIRGRRRSGLIMLAFPNGNVLNASWKVSLPKGHAFRIQYALTDAAVRNSPNGMKFTVTATDTAGHTQPLVQRVLKKGDRTVYDDEVQLDFATRQITFTHDNLGSEMWDVLWIRPEGLVVPTPLRQPARAPVQADAPLEGQAFAALARAIEDLRVSFPERYHAKTFSTRLAAIKARTAETAGDKGAAVTRDFEALRREVLVASPLVGGQPLVFVTRHQYVAVYHAIDTLYEVGEATEGRYRAGGALKLLDPSSGKTRTLVSTPDGIVRSPHVHFDGKRILFAMRRHKKENFHIFEVEVDLSTSIGASGATLRQLTFAPNVSDFDPMYLPDDSIVFSSTREPKYNMCSQDIGANLYRMDRDGANIHQITKSTLFENQSTLLPDGRILYKRWEYVDRNFGDAHGFWTVNPDGTGQATVYGNNTADPAAVYYGQPIPGTGEILCVLSTHHHNMWGPLAIIDPRIATDGTAAIRRTWPADVRGKLSDSGRFNCDGLNRVRPKYESPFPLNDRHFLCSRSTGKGNEMGLYIVDVFGNEVLLHFEQPSCFSPVPLRARPRPPLLPTRRNFNNASGYLYVRNVYQGTHMQDVEPGSVRKLRIIESPEKRGWSPAKWYGQGFMAPGMNWHDFTAKRILGTVPVEADGSAYFAVPADTFIYFQLLDENGMMVQSMRSGTVLQSGEQTGCVGCHDDRHAAPPQEGALPVALRRLPGRIEPWRGEARMFSYMSEVQPVFDKHCVRCHDFGGKGAEKVILAGDRNLYFNASYTQLWRKRYVGAIGGGPAHIQPALSWGSHKSKLVSILRKGHAKDAKLDTAGLDRIITWIDINAPYYPSYYCAYPRHPGGRSPLDLGQAKRLGALTGVDPVRENKFNCSNGPHVSFDRPEKSPCLERVRADAGKYEEALAIVRAGQAMLAQRPRADMAGFRPCEADMRREEKYVARRMVESRNREAIRNGTKQYEGGKQAQD